MDVLVSLNMATAAAVGILLKVLLLSRAPDGSILQAQMVLVQVSPFDNPFHITTDSTRLAYFKTSIPTPKRSSAIHIRQSSAPVPTTTGPNTIRQCRSTILRPLLPPSAIHLRQPTRALYYILHQPRRRPTAPLIPTTPPTSPAWAKRVLAIRLRPR